MFFLLAVSILGAFLASLLTWQADLWLFLLSIPIGASLAAVLAGVLLSFLARRQVHAASSPGHVGGSVAAGLRSLYDGSLAQPLPVNLTVLAEKLAHRRPHRPTTSA